MPVQRCVRHKERNVLEHLPERDRPTVKTRMRRAWAHENHALARDGLRQLAGELDRSHPGAAASLREGLEETLTLTRLGIRGAAQAHAREHEPDRVDGRVHALHQPQRASNGSTRTSLRVRASARPHEPGFATERVARASDGAVANRPLT